MSCNSGLDLASKFCASWNKSQPTTTASVSRRLLRGWDSRLGETFQWNKWRNDRRRSLRLRHSRRMRWSSRHPTQEQNTIDWIQKSSGMPSPCQSWKHWMNPVQNSSPKSGGRQETNYWLTDWQFELGIITNKPTDTEQKKPPFASSGGCFGVWAADGRIPSRVKSVSDTLFFVAVFIFFAHHGRTGHMRRVDRQIEMKRSGKLSTPPRPHGPSLLPPSFVVAPCSSASTTLRLENLYRKADWSGSSAGCSVGH